MTGPKDQLDAARRPDASADDLERLSHSPYNFVLTAVAAHPACPTAVLARLVPESADSSPDQQLLKSIAWNPNTDPATLRVVAERLSGRLNGGRGNQIAFEAGIALFSRFDTPNPTLVALLENVATSTEFRKVVARQSGRPEIRAILRSDRSERVRRAVERYEAAG